MSFFGRWGHQRAVLFKGPNQHGDFNYMISRDKYKDTLFLISENVHDMLYSDDPGGGTAQLRLHCYGHVENDERPAVAGIPTGCGLLRVDSLQ